MYEQASLYQVSHCNFKYPSIDSIRYPAAVFSQGMALLPIAGKLCTLSPQDNKVILLFGYLDAVLAK